MRKLLFLCLGLTSMFGFAQEEIHVDLSGGARDAFFEKSRLIIPVFKLKELQIEEYQEFGVPHEEKPETHSVILPKLGKCIDTGYFYLYSNLNKNKDLSFTPVLVLNYSRRIHPAVFYVDRNHNYDFSDDGAPDTFHFRQKELDISIYEPSDTLQKITTRLSRFPFNEDLSFKKLANEFYKLYGGDKVYVGTDFSFREQRYQFRSSVVVAEEDTFQIALFDANFNGRYDDVGIDMIVLDKAGEELLSRDKMFPVTKDLKECYFERGFKSYKVLSIDPYGRFINFKYDPSQKAKYQLVEGKKVPKIVFRDHKDEKVKLKWYRYKPVYIYFWDREAPEFEEDTAALRLIQEKFCPMIKVIALNYGDNPKMLKGYVEFNKVYWLNGVATKKIIQQFNVEETPYGFLLEKKLRLKQKGVRPAEVLQMLESGVIQSW